MDSQARTSAVAAAQKEAAREVAAVDDPGLSAQLAQVERRLEEIQASLAILLAQRTVKDWYTTAEVAAALNRAEYTVREWCRQGRIRAKKKPCGRGKGGEWLVAHEELTRLENEGLLPSSRAV
jgi:hypothetical protein